MALTQITEKGIKDGEIVNADVNASAAIAGSKLAAATTSVAGSMSAADKTKLDGVAASANNYTHPNHTGDVTSTADGATVIAAGAVDIAMLANGTDGQIITWDASGAPAVVGPGTDGQVLTSTGAGSPPAFEAIPPSVTLSGSTDNQVVTVTGANAMTGESGLTFDGTHLSITDGDLVIGTSGHGIDFSATADGSGTDTSELLDDYEEGTWTPTISFGGSSTGITYGTQEGRYTKIGRLVYANLHITLSSKGSATGGAFIEGLPYNVGSRGTGSMGYYDTIGTIDEPMLFLATNPDKVAIYGSSDTSSPNLQHTHFNNSSRFYMTIIYEI